MPRLSEAAVPGRWMPADAEMDELLAEARALTAAPDPIAPAIDVGSAVRAAPDGPAGVTQSVKVALSKAVAMLPAPLLDTDPTPPPPQPAPSAPNTPTPSHCRALRPSRSATTPG